MSVREGRVRKNDIRRHAGPLRDLGAERAQLFEQLFVHIGGQLLGAADGLGLFLARQADMQLTPATHEGVAGFREEKRVVALGVGGQQAALEQDVDELPHAHGGLLVHDVVGREGVEDETVYLLAFAAGEHGGDDRFAEMQPPLVETVDAGQNLARVHRRVYFFEIRVAVSAVTAADGAFSPK